MMPMLGQQALVSIIVHLVFIAITWWTLQGVRLEAILRPNRVFQGRLLYILLTIVIGSTVANFFLDYLSWSRQLPFLFGGE
ncbi:DUF1146 family protein [Parageobacillus thermoglucosidasius]|uniref:DUF1146 domain-containing protein n=3 Tax=Anoxybacillaceae TaxID=3120669 RepID=A0AAN0YMK2_PARTM|nr:DUF1146 family protein [Parageobacillus thermoglucosidasius]KYD11915.1 hypothetical protein B4168_3765 [Anoxybacillus flavithermus]REK57117.1 MAG: DUF1146 domain-containing protein [Geobacillus sp.]AEH49602.1 Conserved hypothetical protein, integral membrane YwzB [Parageobacillus thermoglucosidasius C56-YS93]ALF09236.1 hypothetical protein AOT13_03870 [Parageobacillus thermoglucosidasius]ANZ29319.1 hypothetical protein BCV53_03885 [Parageobacillus thermoglucosidasius]